MDTDRPDVAKSGRTFDSAYSFSFSVGIGLVLFIAGLVISLTLGQGATIGLIFGIPLLIAGLVLTTSLSAQQGRGRESFPAGPQDVGGADIARSDRPHIAEPGEAGEDQPERDRAQRVTQGQHRSRRSRGAPRSAASRAREGHRCGPRTPRARTRRASSRRS